MVTFIPVECPICKGTGLVPPGFYGSSGTSATSDMCLSCGGTGTKNAITTDIPVFTKPDIDLTRLQEYRG